jgi:hypothetical protein
VRRSHPGGEPRSDILDDAFKRRAGALGEVGVVDVVNRQALDVEPLDEFVMDLLLDGALDFGIRIGSAEGA